MKVLDENIVPTLKSSTQSLIDASTGKVQTVADNIIKGAAYIIGLPSNPTSVQLTTAWEDETGISPVPNGSTIWDVGSSKLWTYYTSVGAWKNTGGPAIGILSSYTGSPQADAVYNASYINSRLNAYKVQIGGSSSATDESLNSGSIAIGYKALSPGAGSIALGTNCQSTTTGSTKGYNTAIGYGVRIGDIYQSVAIGSQAILNGTANYGVAVGTNTTVGGAGSVALGSSSSVSGDNSVALGYYANANAKQYSVALGAQSQTQRDGEVSIGSGTGAYDYSTRYLANVRAGENDTDAVNVAQLNTAVGDIESVLNRLNTGAGV